jgi:hypothetical protein
MRLRNVLGLVVCGALLGAPGVAQAHDHEEQTQQEARQQDRAQHGTEKVGFRELRGNPDQYYGQTVTFEANVDGIIGPNVVRLSSTSFWDWFGGNMLAYAPDAAGIAVSDRHRVTITGVAERYEQAQVRQHLDWIDAEGDIDDRVRERPVIRITHITTEEGYNAMIHRDHHDRMAGMQATDRPVGTTGAQADFDRDRDRDQAIGTTGQAGQTGQQGRDVQQPGAADRDRDRQQVGMADRDRDRQPVGTTGMASPLSNIDEVFDARRRDVGRPVQLQQVQVERMLGNQFFLAEREGNHLLVKLPEGVDRQAVQAGQRISLHGVVMQMPDDVRRMPGVSEDDVEKVRGEDVYILATNVQGGMTQPGAQQQQQQQQQQRQQPGQQPGAQPGQQPQQPQPGQQAQPQGQGQQR